MQYYQVSKMLHYLVLGAFVTFTAECLSAPFKVTFDSNYGAPRIFIVNYEQQEKVSYTITLKAVQPSAHAVVPEGTATAHTLKGSVLSDDNTLIDINGSVQYETADISLYQDDQCIYQQTLPLNESKSCCGGCCLTCLCCLCVLFDEYIGC